MAPINPPRPRPIEDPTDRRGAFRRAGRTRQTDQRGEAADAKRRADVAFGAWLASLTDAEFDATETVAPDRQAARQLVAQMRGEAQP